MSFITSWILPACHLAWFLLPKPDPFHSVPLSLSTVHHEDAMQPDSKLQEDTAGMHNPRFEEVSDAEGISTRHLIIYILALIFILIAGSAALYRYVQRMNDRPSAKHVWTPRANIVTPSAELLSTSLRCSIIRSRLECPSCVTKPASPRSSCLSTRLGS